MKRLNTGRASGYLALHLLSERFGKPACLFRWAKRYKLLVQAEDIQENFVDCLLIAAFLFAKASGGGVTMQACETVLFGKPYETLMADMQAT